MSSEWQELKVLVLGCGSIGKRHARILRDLGVSNICLCDVSESQLDAAVEDVGVTQKARGLDAGLNWGPDAVFICTPSDLHIAQAKTVLESGCHVFMEKPVSDTLDGTDELARVIAESGRKFMIGLCFRYHDGVVKAKQMVDAGRIGRLVSIRAMVGEYLPDIRKDYRDLPMSHHNGVFELMHDVDLALWYAGQEVAEQHVVHGTYSDIGINSPDIFEMLIRFEGRCVGSIHADFFQRPRRRQIDLIGTQGTIVIEFARWDECTVSQYDVAAEQWLKETIATDRDDMFRAEDREFLEAVVGDLPIKCTLAEGLRSLSALSEGRDS